MNDIPTPEQLSLSQEVSLRTKSNELADPYEGLGFVENEELRAIRLQVIEAAASGDSEKLNVLILGYQQQAEKLVDQLEGDDYARGQIVLIVARAILDRDIGNAEGSTEHMRDAIEYAYQMYEDDIVEVLEKQML